MEFGNCCDSSDCCHRTSILKVGIELYAKSYPKTAELLSSKLVFGCSVVSVESQELPRSLHWGEGRGSRVYLGYLIQRAQEALAKLVRLCGRKPLFANRRCIAISPCSNCQGKGKSEKPLTFKGHVGHRATFFAPAWQYDYGQAAPSTASFQALCVRAVCLPWCTHFNRVVLTAMHTETFYRESESQTKDFTRGNGTGGECDPYSREL